jgi:hypothetical protein
LRVDLRSIGLPDIWSAGGGSWAIRISRNCKRQPELSISSPKEDFAVDSRPDAIHQKTAQTGKKISGGRLQHLMLHPGETP